MIDPMNENEDGTKKDCTCHGGLLDELEKAGLVVADASCPQHGVVSLLQALSNKEGE